MTIELSIVTVSVALGSYEASSPPPPPPPKNKVLDCKAPASKSKPYMNETVRSPLLMREPMKRKLRPKSIFD
jgi:hypothetical protein